MRLLLALLVAFAVTSVAVAEPKRPNVLLIVVDDLGNTLGCYGDAFVKSPNIDRLAAKGLRFDRAYCQYPVCNPSRTSFLTGLRPDTTRILDNQTHFRKNLPDVVTLPQLFRQNGYRTTGLGKIYHRGLKIEDVRPEMDDPKSWDAVKHPVGTEAGGKGEGRNMTGGKLAWCRWLAAEGDDQDQPDGQIAAEAIEVLEARHDKPYFLAVGFNKPHDPFIAPKKYFDLYPLEKIPLAEVPKDWAAPYPHSIGRGWTFDFTDRDRREFRRAYFAGVSFMDAQVGKLLDVLDRDKFWDDTIVLLAGDHGYHLGDHHWWNKNTIYELSARAPLIVWAPGMKAAGKSCSRLVEFVDFYPTLAELGGLQPPAGLEGTSFRPLLDDPAKPWKKAAFTQVQRGKIMGRAARTERWRYIAWDGGKAGEELYDQDADPKNYRNLAADAEHAKVLDEMRAILADGWKSALPK